MLLIAQTSLQASHPFPIRRVLRFLAKVRRKKKGFVLIKQLLVLRSVPTCWEMAIARPRQPTSYNSWGQRLKGGLSLPHLLPSHPASITRTPRPTPPQLARLPGSFLYYNRWQMVKRDQKRKNTKAPRLQLPAGKQAAEWAVRWQAQDYTATVARTQSCLESSIAHKVA